MLSPPPRASIQRNNLEQDVNLGQWLPTEYGIGHRNIGSTRPRLTPQDSRRHAGQEFAQGKKAVGLMSYFRDRYFTVHKSQSFEILLLRYETCAKQLSLSCKQISLCFPNALEGTALEFFHTHLTMDTPFDKIVLVMSRQFNSEHRLQLLPSERTALTLKGIMQEKKLSSLSEGRQACRIDRQQRTSVAGWFQHGET